MKVFGGLLCNTYHWNSHKLYIVLQRCPFNLLSCLPFFILTGNHEPKMCIMIY